VGFGFVTIAAATAASGPSWTDIVTALGTVLAGLALPLAFVQLGALRRDQLREQVSKVGAWTGMAVQVGDGPRWKIPVHIRNGSELPVQVDAVDLAVRPWGYERVLAAPEGTSEMDYYMDKRFATLERTSFVPGTIAPGETWSTDRAYYPLAVFDQPQPPIASITDVVVTDAAGYQWEIRSGRAGPARRVQRWRRWEWKRRGHL
jgi:hypothetical protein